jgi:hypothetical protein
VIGTYIGLLTNKKGKIFKNFAGLIFK